MYPYSALQMHNLKKPTSAIFKTDLWLREFIIGLNICPFARVPYEQGQIRIADSLSLNDESMLESFTDEMAFLELNLRSDIATTMLLFSECDYDFESFNDWSGICDDFLKDSNLENDFQLVVFHPKFYFKDSKKTDVGNLVNQSPSPMIHIIRNIDIDEAMANYEDIDKIPERNQLKLQRRQKLA